MDSNLLDIAPVAMGAPLSPDKATYPVGCIFPWYAADNKRDAKAARNTPPVGWEYTGTMVKLKPKTVFNPEKTGVKYVLYLRKV